MKVEAKSVQEYISNIAEEKKVSFEQLLKTIQQNLPNGFETGMSYGMVGFYVPHELYPKGYHCDAKLPLPFAAIAAQKNFIALYHMGIYTDENLLQWFQSNYSKHVSSKLDMGKSCIRFKKNNEIPFALIAELFQKMQVNDWIKLYENTFTKNKK
jgi:uncharacterized protein YdhG (YjbR/CyaY superfamily)